MASFILGRKRGMTQVFADDGKLIPVTVISAGPCVVTQIRTPEKDGHRAYQLGYEAAKDKHLNKPQREFFKKLGIEPLRNQREFRPGDADELPEVGAQITVSVFEVGNFVDVIGTSKGKGFQGTVKRHGFALGPATHGSMNYRRPGSIGCSAYPARVFKGKRMSGQMGNKRFTQKNLLVVGVDTERNLLLVRGAIPGPNGGLVQVRTAKTHIPRQNEQIPTLLVSLGAGVGDAGGEAQE